MVYGTGVENIPWRAAKEPSRTSFPTQFSNCNPRQHPFIAVPVRVRFREMELFSSPGPVAKDTLRGQIWHGDTSSRPPRKRKRTLHQLKPVNKHKTNGVTL